MFLWDCQDLWLVLKFCNYLIFTKMQPTMYFLILTWITRWHLPLNFKDKGYPLLPWLMIPHKQNANVPHIILKKTYNKHLSRGRDVVENVVGKLKKSFKKLLLKNNLHILFILMLLLVVIHCITSFWMGKMLM
jgi:hypothetical protein